MTNGITVSYLLFIITNTIKYQDIKIERKPLWARRDCKRNASLFSNKYIVYYRSKIPNIRGPSVLAGGWWVVTAKGNELIYLLI